MEDRWERLKEKYPNIEQVLDRVYREQLKLYDMIEDLEENYKLEGYEWKCDPNKIGIGINPWYLQSEDIIQESINEADERLKKQSACVEGKHHFQVVGALEWCQYCGTIKVGKAFLYPEQPHFLPRRVYDNDNGNRA